MIACEVNLGWQCSAGLPDEIAAVEILVAAQIVPAQTFE